MTEFKVVDRSHIPQRRGIKGAPSALSLALVNGSVVFIPHPKGGLAPAVVMNLFAKNSHVRRNGLQPHTRQGVEDGVEGLFVWADKAQP